MDFRKKITKNNYLAGFAIIVFVLAIVRLIFPSVAEDKIVSPLAASVDSVGVVGTDVLNSDTAVTPIPVKNVQASPEFPLASFFDRDGRVVKNRINSVPGFSRTFPDNNDVQLMAANANGVKPVEDRHDAEKRMKGASCRHVA